MNDDFSKYLAMKESGATPERVFLEAKRDGIDSITMFRLLRTIFVLNLTQAKEVVVKGEGWANSLVDYQNQIADSLTDEK